MSRLAQATIFRFCRRSLCCAVLLVCALVVVRSLTFETFHVPTGSMAPALRGNHRVATCPRCASEVVFGREDDPRHHAKAFCPYCGCSPIPVAEAKEAPGDDVLVNKAAYAVRSPSRWEIIVFRVLSSFYIKRLLGLPGEEIRIHDGDIYVDGKLCRKSFVQAKSMRVLLFDQTKASSDGWKLRWDYAGVQGDSIVIDGRWSPKSVTYRNYSLDTNKCGPIRDEQAYNGGLHARRENVHDFMIETEVEVGTGRGSLGLRLCDGHDWVEVVLPVGDGPIEAFAWPIDRLSEMRKIAEANTKTGSRYRIELAFVDRRVSLAVDGRLLLELDLPETPSRAAVDRPFQAHADGVLAKLHRFRLYRDVHYRQDGRNAVRGQSVRLGADQYFVLGDNSPSSDDSRFWPDGGRIDGSRLIGPVIRVQRNGR